MFRPICVALAIAAAGLADPLAAQEQRQITVSGTGEVSASPDMATLRFGVVAADPKADAAMAEMSAALGQVMDALSAAGIAPKDVQTTAIDLSPRYESRDPERRTAPEISGFEARSTLSVTARDLDALGTLLDAVVSSGSNQIDGLSFGMQDGKSLANDARKAAVADALAKAELYAEAANVSLGAVQSISELSGTPIPQMKGRAIMMAADAPVPVAQGEVSLSAEVIVTIALTD